MMLCCENTDLKNELKNIEMANDRKELRIKSPDQNNFANEKAAQNKMVIYL